MIQETPHAAVDKKKAMDAAPHSSSSAARRRPLPPPASPPAASLGASTTGVVGVGACGEVLGRAHGAALHGWLSISRSLRRSLIAPLLLFCPRVCSHFLRPCGRSAGRRAGRWNAAGRAASPRAPNAALRRLGARTALSLSHLASISAAAACFSWSLSPPRAPAFGPSACAPGGGGSGRAGRQPRAPPRREGRAGDCWNARGALDPSRTAPFPAAAPAPPAARLFAVSASARLIAAASCSSKTRISSSPSSPHPCAGQNKLT